MRPLLVILFSLMIAEGALAGNDPSIKGALRADIQKAMSSHIDGHQVSGSYMHYDAVDGKLIRLKLEELHSGIVKKGDYYVSCADFVDDKGRLYDLDFLVAGNRDNLTVFQAVVHKVNSEKRVYHLED